MAVRATRHRVALILGVLALAVLDSASGDSADTPATEPPPDVRITRPEDQAIVRSGSFEIAGDFVGSATEIEVFADGELLGPALRGEEPFEWRLPERNVNVDPGLHRITATATGEGGESQPTGIWVLVDADLPFEIAIVPEEASYMPEEAGDDPTLLLLGNDVPLTLGATGTPGVDAGVNGSLRTGAKATVDIDIVTEAPGVYPVTVRAEGPDGTVREATHTITIIGPTATSPPATTVPATTAATGTGVLRDDFEGRDLWIASVDTATNGASAAAQIAAGGNPGGFREMTHTLPGTDDGEGNPTRIAVTHTFTAGGWDPASDGALEAIRYTEDQIMLDPPFPGAAVGTLFVVGQGEQTFTATINEGNVFTNTEWVTVSTELRPADFAPAPGPDFSAGGAPLTFAILRSNTHRGSSQIVVRHGIDNWTLELVAG